ncbi:MAG: hypothetical protein AVDCRST_MAG28-873 [uncultured Rubrobacteraceae bacterium]|uniref:HNH domain-containing protein n=1 Tax=uncultured Rubrobacteraceae bacterium TaxID=349277 RepID=A0A6J4QJ68_9ACTN|nr:MAG: hypothetical protein AVDCRST_MAG28-873 [uncultured Rubrobacteraceae bacterium]
MSETNGGAGGEACGLCGREVQKLTRHHLVPRTRHKNIKNKRNNKALDRQALLQTVGLCAPCHRHVHATIPNKELEREYNTLEALKGHPEIDKFVEWIKRKPHGTAAARTRRRAG